MIPAEATWKPDVGPLVIRFDEAGTDGIFADVEPSGLMVLFGADAVIEVVTLP